MLRRIFLCALSLTLVPSLVFARGANDTHLAEQWYLTRIEASAAWDVTIGSSDVVVAILDTGVDIHHPDLEQNIWTNSGEIAGNNIDDDGNGFVDDLHGWDFVDSDADILPDTHDRGSGAADHGTLIAGIIGGEGNNGQGIAGLAWNVRLMPVRMLNALGSGTEAMATNAVRYAVQNGADIINLSFAGETTTASLRDAVHEAYRSGVVVVAAMGNDGKNTDHSYVYPACLQDGDEDWVIGVTSTDEHDFQTDFTNYGKVCSDLGAPGTDIFGAKNSANSTDDYQSGWAGTSTSSPMVAGTVALLLSAYPSLSVDDVQNILKLSVDPLTHVSGGVLGVGRLNAGQALSIAQDYTGDAPDTSSGTTETNTTDEAAPTETPTSSSDKDAGADETAIASSYIGFGAPAGSAPTVQLHTADGEPFATFAAYASSFTGGVRIALGAFTNFRGADVITGAGPGGGPHVRIFTSYGALVDEFFPYDTASRAGVWVAAGDIDADSQDDIVTAVGAGVSNDIIVWSGSGEEKSRFTADAFGTAPLAVSVVDIDDDWEGEFAVTTADGSSSKVAVYDTSGALLAMFDAFTQSGTLSVSTVDINDDFIQEIAVASQATVGDVRQFTKTGALTGVSTPFATAVGIRLTGGDMDIDGKRDMILMENKAGGQIKILSGNGKTTIATWTAPSFGGLGIPYFASW